MKKKVLVTGGSGFVGANLTRRLLAHGYEVHAIVRKGGNIWRLKGISNKINVYPGALDNLQKLERLIKKVNPRLIFHLSTYGSYPKQQNIQAMIDTNLTCTLDLLMASKEINYDRLIITGSSSEYGKKRRPMKESDIPEPNNFYAVTKVAETHLAQVFAKTYQKPVTILRLFNVYGPFEEEGRLVRSVIESALSLRPILLGSGEEARDLIYIEDVVDALLAAAKRKNIGPGEVFNIGTGVQTTILELAKQVVGLTKSSSKIKLNAYPGRPWDTKHWAADMIKTKNQLRFKARHNLLSGLTKTIEWYKK